MHYLFVHSPLLGPLSLDPVADVLDGTVPDCRGFVEDAPPLWSAFTMRATRQTFEDVVVVAHSGAGAVVPAIAARQGHVRALVFVDAVLPPTSGAYRMPAHLRRRIGEFEAGGLLAPGSSWWPSETLARHLPDADMRDALAAEEPQVPVALYDEAASVPAGWSERPCGYVRLSAAYDREADEAARRGWPTESLDLTHLAPMSHAGDVASAIVRIVELTAPEGLGTGREPA